MFLVGYRVKAKRELNITAFCGGGGKKSNDFKQFLR